MTLRILLLLGWTAWFAAAQEPACHFVAGDRILARDLAAALPEFAAVPPETLLGSSPIPGSRRTFHGNEIQALARRFGIATESAADVCFEWEMRPLDRERVLAAMQESLGVPGAQIEIADIATGRVPPGRIEFPAAKLGAPPSSSPRTPVLWRGDVVYGDGHRFAIWARAIVSTTCSRLVAAENLKAGQIVQERQLRASSVPCFPGSAKEAPAGSAVAGMVVTRPINAGSEVRADLLALPNDINRGDNVRVEVRSGRALLGLTARAMNGGRTGETIPVRNPETNRVFPVRITGKGTALVDAGNTKGI